VRPRGKDSCPLETQSNLYSYIMSLSTASTTPIALAALAASAALVLAQSDWFSRTIACSPEQLQRKRVASYQYQWNQAVIRQIRLFYGKSPSQAMECAELITTEEEIRDLVQRLVRAQQQHSSKGKPENKKAEHFEELRILHIGRDSEIMPSSSSSMSSNPIDAYFVWLQYFEREGESTAPRTRRIWQIPMLKFGIAFKEAMEKFLIRNITLCFIYDATPQCTSSIIVPLLTTVTKLFPPEVSLSSSSSSIPPVNVSRNPAWIVQLSLLLAASQEETTSYQSLQQCLFAFCCLEACFLRVAETASHSTMIYTIPMSIIPIVLPLLHDLFPDDRHVFCYTGCLQTLSHKPPLGAHSDLDFFAFHTDVAWTTPIYMQSRKLEGSSSMFVSAAGGGGHLRPESFYRAMTQLPLDVASITECWMAALDTLLVRQKQKGISFLPYVCKVDYLLPSPADMTNRRWSVRSLLQYVTGTKSREMASETLDAACRWLAEQPPPMSTSPWQRAVENVVFQHKLILLPNKTLVDTVQPSEHWTLKQSAKLGGCSCCGPNEDDDEEGEMVGGTALISREDMFRINPIHTRGFVDGKTAFAFDPSQFA
jgi:hypothetical protein